MKPVSASEPTRSHLTRFGLALTLAMLPASTGTATTYRAYADREIVQEAELLVEGTVVAVRAPPGVDARKRPGVSMAVVRVAHVFKGAVKVGDEIRFVYWSGQGDPPDEWRKPDQYRVGEKIVLPLTPKGTRLSEGYDAPEEAAAAAWVNPFRWHYDEQVQSARFRSVAAVWRAPEKHLDDPARRGDAVHFLAAQNRLPERLLLRLLGSADVGDQSLGCRAARRVPSRAALGPLAAILEARGREIASWKQPPAGEEEKARRGEVEGLYSAAQGALSVTPLDGDRDGPALLRLALAGNLDDRMLPRLLHAGPARWELARGLARELKAAPRLEPLRVLHALDARAAYRPLQQLASPCGVNRPDEAGRLANEYHTAWAQRFVLDHAQGYGPDTQFRYVVRSFDFTHEPVSPYDRRADAGRNDTWESLYVELREAAEEQWRVFVKRGPCFSRLRQLLEGMAEWEVHCVADGSFTALTGGRRDELLGWIVRAADPRALGLDAGREAEWIVDLSDPTSRSLPTGQLWVAADGTFGFSWLPDRAWGKSEPLAALLRRWTGPEQASGANAKGRGGRANLP
jgi:hypothetical protein